MHGDNCGGRNNTVLSSISFCHKMFFKVKGDVSEPNHLGCAKELTAPTDQRQYAVLSSNLVRYRINRGPRHIAFGP